MTEFNITHDIHFIHFMILILKEILYFSIEPSKNTNNCSTCSNAYIHYIVVKIYKGIFTHTRNLQSETYVVHFRGTKRFILNEYKLNQLLHLIREQLNQLSIVLIFIFLHRLIKPGRSTPVSFDRRDRRRPAKLSRSKKATGQVTKGQAAQPTYAGFANEVVAWIFTCNPAPTFTDLKIYERLGMTFPFFVVHVYVITIRNEKEVLKCAQEICQ